MQIGKPAGNRNVVIAVIISSVRRHLRLYVYEIGLVGDTGLD